MNRVRQLLVGTVIAAGVYGTAVGSYLIVSHQPRSEALAASEARLDELARTVAKAGAAARARQLLDTEILEVEETLASLDRVLPIKLDETGESGALVALASGLGLEPLEIGVGAPKPRDFYLETEITFWLEEPSVANLTDLMTAIENELPLRRVTGLWLHLEDGRPLEARLTVSLYSLTTRDADE